LLRSRFDQKPTAKPPSACGQNRNTNGRRLAATATAADWLTIFMLGKNQTKFLIKLFAALGHSAVGE